MVRFDTTKAEYLKDIPFEERKDVIFLGKSYKINDNSYYSTNQVISVNKKRKILDIQFIDYHYDWTPKRIIIEEKDLPVKLDEIDLEKSGVAHNESILYPFSLIITGESGKSYLSVLTRKERKFKAELNYMATNLKSLGQPIVLSFGGLMLYQRIIGEKFKDLKEILPTLSKKGVFTIGILDSFKNIVDLLAPYKSDIAKANSIYFVFRGSRAKHHFVALEIGKRVKYQIGRKKVEKGNMFNSNLYLLKFGYVAGSDRFFIESTFLKPLTEDIFKEGKFFIYRFRIGTPMSALISIPDGETSDFSGFYTQFGLDKIRKRVASMLCGIEG